MNERASFNKCQNIDFCIDSTNVHIIISRMLSAVFFFGYVVEYVFTQCFIVLPMNSRVGLLLPCIHSLLFYFFFNLFFTMSFLYFSVECVSCNIAGFAAL